MLKLLGVIRVTCEGEFSCLTFVKTITSDELLLNKLRLLCSKIEPSVSRTILFGLESDVLAPSKVGLSINTVLAPTRIAW